MRTLASSAGIACCVFLAAQGIGAAAPAPQFSPDDIVKRFAPAPVTRGINLGAARSEPANSFDLLLTFDFNSTELTEQGKANAKAFAEALKRDELKSHHFQIEGYTDAAGAPEYNVGLSERRAAAVRNFLAAQGVDPARLKTIGFGSKELANPAKPLAGENLAGRYPNRAVIFQRTEYRRDSRNWNAPCIPIRTLSYLALTPSRRPARALLGRCASAAAGGRSGVEIRLQLAGPP